MSIRGMIDDLVLADLQEAGQSNSSSLNSSKISLNASSEIMGLSPKVSSPNNANVNLVHHTVHNNQTPSHQQRQLHSSATSPHVFSAVALASISSEDDVPPPKPPKELAPLTRGPSTKHSIKTRPAPPPPQALAKKHSSEVLTSDSQPPSTQTPPEVIFKSTEIIGSGISERPRPLPVLRGPAFTGPPPSLPVLPDFDQSIDERNYRDLKVRSSIRQSFRADRGDVRSLFSGPISALLSSNTPANNAPEARNDEKREGKHDPPILQKSDSAFWRPRTKRGWLYKRGGKDGSKGARHRFFVLENGTLMYFKSETDSRAVNRIDAYDMLSVENNSKNPLALELKTVQRTYYLLADNVSEYTDWCQTLGAVIETKHLFKIKSKEEKHGFLYVRPSDTKEWCRCFVSVKSGNIQLFKVSSVIVWLFYSVVISISSLLTALVFGYFF
jgi:hypothetical protein